jgi:hypothetical protein
MFTLWVFPLLCLAFCWFCLALVWFQNQRSHGQAQSKEPSWLHGWNTWNDRYLPWKRKVAITLLLTGLVFLLLLFNRH